eukprot:2542677-Pleurochrysis_carterae.AAC.1
MACRALICHLEDGCLSCPFEGVYCFALLGAPGLPRVWQVDELRTLFRRIDTNDSGTITQARPSPNFCHAAQTGGAVSMETAALLCQPHLSQRARVLLSSSARARRVSVCPCRHRTSSASRWRAR